MPKHADSLSTRRLVCGVASWVAFVVAWGLVLLRDSRTWLPELMVPVVSLVVVTLVTLAWVRHNLAIYRRKGPRRGVPVADTPWESDSLGRRLELPDLSAARVVRLELDGNVKRYEVEA